MHKNIKLLGKLRKHGKHQRYYMVEKQRKTKKAGITLKN